MYETYTSSDWTCPNCFNINTKGIFCAKCGTKKEESEPIIASPIEAMDDSWNCEICGTTNKGIAKFCKGCGNARKIMAVVPPVVDVSVPTSVEKEKVDIKIGGTNKKVEYGDDEFFHMPGDL